MKHSHHADHTAQLARLRRIEGQVKGITKMVEEGRYCIDILTQTRAIHAALRKVEEEILHNHVQHCVSRAVKGHDEKARDHSIAELIEAVGKFAGQ